MQIEFVAAFRLGPGDTQMINGGALDAGRTQINANEQGHKRRPRWPHDPL
jgi:hypothetical protein